LADTSTRGQPPDASAKDESPVDANIADSARASARLAAVPAKMARNISTHWQFSLVVLVALIIRAVVIIGYPPIMWFNDSFNYFSDAVTHVPDSVRPNGYPFFLSLLLLPTHTMYPVAILQAAMGVAMGIAIYALLRHRGLPWWGAALPALPVLFDVFELQVEHLVTADTLFTFLVTIALVICCWRDRPSVPAMAVAGLLIGYATIVRSVGEPLLIVFILGMLLRRAGWRRLVALAVAGVLPIVAYATWFHHTTGKYALTESSGTFLYSRVSTFAKCSAIDPSAKLRTLCDPTPTWARPASGEYLWANYELWPYNNHKTPLASLTGFDNTKRFTPYIEGLTQKFAEQAIIAQPLDYARVVAKDTLHTFGWNRQRDPGDIYGNGPPFRFGNTPQPVPWWAMPTKGDAQANALNSSLHKYLKGSLGQPKVVHPWAGFIQGYQSVVWLRGPFLAVIVLIGAAGAVARWRRWGGIVLLPWLIGAALIVLPPLTAGFSYRYVLSAVPPACLAAGLVFATRPGEKSIRALAADLGRYFGRRVPVQQE
jgi:hypothetical protein